MTAPTITNSLEAVWTEQLPYFPLVAELETVVSPDAHPSTVAMHTFSEHLHPGSLSKTVRRPLEHLEYAILYGSCKFKWSLDPETMTHVRELGGEMLSIAELDESSIAIAENCGYADRLVMGPHGSSKAVITLAGGEVKVVIAPSAGSKVLLGQVGPDVIQLARAWLRKEEKRQSISWRGCLVVFAPKKWRYWTGVAGVEGLR